VLTNRRGEYIKNGGVILPYENVLENGAVMLQNRMYTSSERIVEGFATNTGLSDTSVEGYGAGLYGSYTRQNDDDVELVLRNPFYIRDRYHSDSLRLASLHTNMYVDECILYLKTHTYIDINTIRRHVDATYPDNLTVLWFIVYERTHVRKPDIKEILVRYISYYFSYNNMYDTFTGQVIKFLPINYIMDDGKYDSIIDAGWGSRSCVSYKFDIHSSKMTSSKNMYYVSNELIN